jgi:hypothetical protein
MIAALSSGSPDAMPAGATRRRGDAMTLRTTSRTVVFARPFLLSGIIEEQPAGAYIVETDEELIETVSVAAYRRVATLIRLPGRPGSSVLSQVVDIDPAELAAALDRDAAAAPEPSPAAAPRGKK